MTRAVHQAKAELDAAKERYERLRGEVDHV